MTDIVEQLRDRIVEPDPTTSGELEEAIAEIERLREALLFYAEPDRWDEFVRDEHAACFDRNVGSELGNDEGEIARTALGLVKLRRRYGTTVRLAKAE